MASLFGCFLFISCLILFLISQSTAETVPFRPKALVLPVSKDKCTHQYITQIDQRTPLLPLKLTVDIGASFMWMDCEEGYISSSYRPVSCNSSLCSLSGSQECNYCSSTPKPGCHNDTCCHFPTNEFVQIQSNGEIGQDVVSVKSFDGKKAGTKVLVPGVPFACTEKYMLENLADGVTGVAGFGRNSISLPAYFSSALGFPKKFAVCMSSPTSSNGFIFFGDGPYSIISNDKLIYTPILGSDYYIGVKSIRVDGKKIEFDKNLLSIGKDGTGGTKISTVNPYTVLHSSIYKALVDAVLEKYGMQVRYLPMPLRTTPVPFRECFSTIDSTRAVLLSIVPIIDLMLENDVYWRILPANSMVEVNSNTLCLAFIDGGTFPGSPAIIIGGRQLEDNLLQFDLASSRLGFSSNLVARNTTCSNLTLI